MYHSSLVAVANSVYYLIDNFAGLNLFQFAVLADPLVHLASSGHLHNHDHGLAFQEGVVELHHVLVSEHLQVLRFLVDVANLIGIRKLFGYINVLNGHLLLAGLLNS